MKFQLYPLKSATSFSFRLVDDQDNVLLLGQEFPDRDSAISAIQESIDALRSDDALQVKEEEGSFYLHLTAEGKERMKGNALAQREEAEANADKIRKEADANQEFEVVILQTPLSSARESVDYDSLYDFSQASHSGEPGFDPYQNEKDEQFYFLFNNLQGNPLLFSRSFPSLSKRDQRIRQVIKHAPNENRYERSKKEGKPFFILNSSNGAEIARSRTFENQNEMEEAIAYMMTEAPTFQAQYPAPEKMRRSVNEYDFDQPSTSGEKGFDPFRSKKNKLYYFHFNDEKGEPILFSESYSSSRSRQNGIRSVIKNGGLEDRYEVKGEDGQHFFILKAGNNQEIARSKNLNSKKAVDDLLSYLVEEIPTYAEEYKVELTPEVSESFVLGASARGGLDAVQNGDDDYDLGQKGSSTEAGFDAFHSDKHDQFYFHYNDAEGKPLLYSEGYQNDKSRDNGIKSVIKNSIVEEHFAIKEDDQGKYFTLRAANHQEVGRSRYFESEEGLLAAMAWFRKNVHKSASAYGLALTIPAALMGGEGYSSIPSSEEKKSAILAASSAQKTAKVKQNISGESGTAALDTKGRRPWWLWLILIAILLLIVFLLLRSYDNSPLNPTGAAGESEKEKISLVQAKSIRLGEMGNLPEALNAGYIDRQTYDIILNGDVSRANINWIERVDASKLIADGLMTEAQWNFIKNGELKWDWMQMKPEAEIFGGLGGLQEAQNQNYIDKATFDSLLLGELDIDGISLRKRLDLDALVGEGFITEGQKDSLLPGMSGFQAIMFGNPSTQLGKWGSLDELLAQGIISKITYDSLQGVDNINLQGFDWESNIDLDAAARVGKISATFRDRIQSGEVGIDWINRKEIPVEGSEESTLSESPREVVTAENTPLPTFGPFEFNSNFYIIRDADRPNLEKLVSYLHKNESLQVIITGHTDSDGSDAYNKKLAKRRAEAAKDFLVEEGIAGSRISTQSMGEAAPRMTNQTERGKAKNRRVEIEMKRKE